MEPEAEESLPEPDRPALAAEAWVPLDPENERAERLHAERAKRRWRGRSRPSVYLGGNVPLYGGV